MRFPPPPTCMEGMYTAGRGGQAVCYDRGESGRHQAPTISTRVNYGPPLSLLPTVNTDISIGSVQPPSVLMARAH